MTSALNSKAINIDMARYPVTRTSHPFLRVRHPTTNRDVRRQARAEADRLRRSSAAARAAPGPAVCPIRHAKKRSEVQGAAPMGETGGVMQARGAAEGAVGSEVAVRSNQVCHMGHERAQEQANPAERTRSNHRPISREEDSCHT
jgi:hypothetical protein